MSLSPGQRLERYEVLERLGDGGMASVFKARHVHLQSLHALKVLDPALLTDADLKARFLDEGRIQAQLRHPNLVAVTDVFSVPGLAVLVMDFAAGESIRQRLDRGWRASPDEALALALPLLDGLGYAHAHGVVHRDVKPSNVVLSEPLPGRVEPRLIDFGVAKITVTDARIATSGGKRATRTGARIGTLDYMAPEQIRGRTDIDGRADLYALAVTLYEALAGVPPFVGANDFDLMKAIVEEDPADVRRLAPDVPRALAEAVMRGMAKDRDRRFADAAAFAAALRGGSSRARTDPPPATPPATGPQAAPPVAPDHAGRLSRVYARRRDGGVAQLLLAGVCGGTLATAAAALHRVADLRLDEPIATWLPFGVAWPLAVLAPIALLSPRRWALSLLIPLALGALSFRGGEALAPVGVIASFVVGAIAYPSARRVRNRALQALGALVLGGGAATLAASLADDQGVIEALSAGLFGATWWLVLAAIEVASARLRGPTIG